MFSIYLFTFLDLEGKVFQDKVKTRPIPGAVVVKLNNATCWPLGAGLVFLYFPGSLKWDDDDDDDDDNNNNNNNNNNNQTIVLDFKII